jgi:hypothetical protein
MGDACRRSIHLKDGVEASQRFRSSGRSAPSSTLAFNEQSGNCSGPEIGRCGIRVALSPFQTKYSRRLPIQLVNDKGHYRQLRTRWQSPDLLKSQPPSNIPVISEALREMSRVGTEFGSPLRRGLGIVDVNALIIHYLDW